LQVVVHQEVRRDAEWKRDEPYRHAEHTADPRPQEPAQDQPPGAADSPGYDTDHQYRPEGGPAASGYEVGAVAQRRLASLVVDHDCLVNEGPLHQLDERPRD